MGRWPAWVTSAVERVVGPRADAPARARTRTHVARHVQAVAPTPPAPAPAAEDVPWPEIPIERAAQPEIPRRVLRPAPPRAPRGVAAAPAGEDATGVSAAMRALRVERDPVRARGLLARYLAEHPNGTLAEEALALSIEAALAHRDADVVALANRYLRLYPRGSFQALARQALDGNGVAQPSAAQPSTRDQ
jgi:hypothetical protein